MIRRFIISLVLFSLAFSVFAQPERLGIGLSFAQKVRFNNGDTGNPGLNVKTWLALDEGRKLHLVPSITAFNKGESNKVSHWVNNYRFHGDLDVHYVVFHEKTVKLAAMAGINYSHMISKNDRFEATPVVPVFDSTLYALGPNLGMNLEMRMRPQWDFIVSVRYTAAGINPADLSQTSLFYAPLSGLIIQVHGAYHFRSRGKGYR